MQVLNDPQQATNFFHRLSRVEPPVLAPFYISLTQDMPPTYHEGMAGVNSAADNSRNLDHLERRIEELAQELQKAQADRTCPQCAAQVPDKSIDHCAKRGSIPSYWSNRPSPPKDRISFFACPLRWGIFVDDRLVGI